MKIYVASPYDGALKYYNDRRFVRELALKSLSQANKRFDSQNELFSPVLAFMNSLADKSRDEIMQRCFEEIDKCDLFFVSDVSFVTASEGMIDEFVYSLKSGKEIVFQSYKIQEVFKQESKKGEK